MFLSCLSVIRSVLHKYRRFFGDKYKSSASGRAVGALTLCDFSCQQVGTSRPSLMNSSSSETPYCSGTYNWALNLPPAELVTSNTCAALHVVTCTCLNQYASALMDSGKFNAARCLNQAEYQPMAEIQGWPWLHSLLYLQEPGILS